MLELLEKREQAPRLPAMALLESEVRELYDAHVYLDMTNPKSALAVDLLLGTQGWRRFALVSWQEFLARDADKARRVLAQQVVQQPAPADDWDAGMVPGMAMAAEDAPEMREERSARAPRAAPPRMAAPAPAAAPRPQQPKKSAPPPPPAAAKIMPAVPPMAREMAAPRMGGRRDVAGGRGRAMDRKRAPMVMVREYAHPRRPDRKPNERTDFTETLYWNAGLNTDAQGKATVRFALSDSVTTFRVLVDAHDREGALGSGLGGVQSVEPFYAEAKLPLEVTAGDDIALPVTVVNATDSALKDGSLSVSAPRNIRVSGLRSRQAFNAGARQRQIVHLGVGQFVGKAQITVAAKGGNYSDTVTRELAVKPAGFPMEVASGGTLEPDATATIGIDIPQSYAPGSITTDVAVFPAPLGNLTAALERLIQEPSGCFEQTSSTSYPLVMAQQYFMSHTGVDAALVTRSRDTLRRGYDRLRGFECKGTGYEWFGQDPGHEALSAYGLMEFVDMSKVMQVDMAMVDRTRGWILAKRDGAGGFKSERRALHTWLVEPELHNGYITWALLESGERGISREVRSFKEAALRSANSYVVALGANVAMADGDKSTARKLMDKLTTKQTKEGWVDGSTTSIVGSGGEALRIETTSLAVLAWLREPAYAGAVENAMRFITESCKGGRYGSTQSTVLAL
ncbi:MAG: A-macroglobulin complement component, partial [Deltaproteobacteria bacterium]|nr:A-macroglobulin complement component [Deltaproteobacteria bacterium]